MRFPWIRRKSHEDNVSLWRRELMDQIDRTTAAEAVNRASESLIRELRDAGKASEQRVAELVRDNTDLRMALEHERVCVERAEVAIDLLREERECTACAAKDQTIALMADVVDFERARSVQMHQRPNAEGAVRVLPTRPEEVEERKWVTDDEEAIMGALQSGALGADPEEAYERASKMLAAIGAQNVEVEVVKPN